MRLYLGARGAAGGSFASGGTVTSFGIGEVEALERYRDALLAS
jgi:hypothetical protein